MNKTTLLLAFIPILSAHYAMDNPKDEREYRLRIMAQRGIILPQPLYTEENIEKLCNAMKRLHISGGLNITTPNSHRHPRFQELEQIKNLLDKKNN